MKTFTYKYLIIGGGMTADAAIQGIREIDSEGTIGLISREEDPPYARPPLTKGLWTGEEEIEDIDLETSDKNVEMHLNQTVTKIDPAIKKVYDRNKNEYTYQKLLIASGGTPKKLPNIDEPGIIYYRTLIDYKKLRDLVDKNNTFGVIGGGFIGSEIAAGIKMYNPDSKVSMIFPENGIGGLIFPKKLSEYLNAYYREKGVDVFSGELVAKISKDKNEYLVETKSGKIFKFDALIAGLGINPTIEFLKETEIKVDDGIIVNEFLQTNIPDVYAAGDVARYHTTLLNRTLRVEHEDNALNMGEIVGQNMAGSEKKYEQLSYFYSDLFDVGYEAVGILNSKLETVESWKEPYEEGIVYYLENEKVVGVLLWNVWEKVDDARQLISERGTYPPEDLKSKIEF
ncbi:MAG: NAD(P)/FAD-dependent oxidoreductase [Candidatus Thorarchaeota archaeon]